MKNRILVAAFMLIHFAINAQDNLKITEETRSMERTSANCLVVSWPKASAKQVRGTWSSYAKKFKGKLSYNKKIDEYFLDDTEFKDMSENAVDVTVKVYDKGENGVELAFWFNLGVTYLSSKDYPERYPSAEVFLRKFDLLVFADMAQQQLKDEKKKLSDMEKNLKKLAKVESGELKKIEKQKQIIAKAEAAIGESEKVIAENNALVAKQELDITTQKEVIETIKMKLKEAGKK